MFCYDTLIGEKCNKVAPIEMLQVYLRSPHQNIDMLMSRTDIITNLQPAPRKNMFPMPHDVFSG